MKRTLVLLMACLFVALHGFSNPNTGDADIGKYNALSFNIVPDGTTLNSQAIQDLIDHCHDNGGGTIYFPAGTYLSGSIIIKSNVFIELAPGAVILGSTNIADYPTENLIRAEGASNFGIIGHGIVNGSGDAFWKDKASPYVRPLSLIYFLNCNKVHIKDISIINSPYWTIDLVKSAFIWIDGISIVNDRKSPNSDGIDVVSSSNVFISNCYINTGDDAICFKSVKDDTTTSENIVVENCILITDDSAIKFGTRAHGIIRDCLFNNIVIRNSEYGIAFYMKDGGSYENIRFSDITLENANIYANNPGMKSNGVAIYMDIENRGGYDFGAIENIYFDNISIDSYGVNCLFLGQPDKKIENIFLSNIHYRQYERKSFESRRKPRGVRTLVDLAPNDRAHIQSLFTFSNIRGIHINNITIDDLSYEDENEFFMIWAEESEDIRISQYTARTINISNSLPQIFLHNIKDAMIINSFPESISPVFLQLSGKETSNITLMYNDFKKMKSIVGTGEEVDAHAIYLDFNRIK